MIIGYDRNPNAPIERKLQSLMESVQMALNEAASDLDSVKKSIQNTSEESSSGGGDTPGSATSYNELSDKPMIEGVTLQGAKSFPDLNLDVMTNAEILDIIDNLNI